MPVTTGAVFNNPNGTTAERNKVKDHIIGLINQTGKGRLIRASMYALQDQDVTNAFIAAHNRGVKVQIALDDKHSGHAASVSLISALGTDKKKNSYVYVGPHKTGLISTVQPSINHNKVFLFSGIGDAEDVVVTSSANFTTLNTESFYNNAYTVVGDTTLYMGYRTFFKDQVSGTVRTNDYRKDVTSETSNKLYTYPRSYGDPLSTIMKNLGPKDGGGGPTVIRVATPSLTRTAMAKALLKQAKAGARVEIVYKAMGIGAGPILKHPNIHLYPMPNSSNTVHSKYITVDGDYAGNKNNKVVWVGSHNLNMSSLVDDDENVLRVIDNATHDAYRTNFKAMQDEAMCN